VLAVSDPATRGTESWESWCGRVAASGAGGLLVRERDAGDREKLGFLRAARSSFAGTLLAHRRLDLALAGGADGVHLPGAGAPSLAVRAALGEDRLVGRSTHRFDEVAAERGVADYVLYGPLFPTPGKQAPERDESLEALARVCRIGIPVIAVGGIDAENAALAFAAGATGIAAIRAFAADRSAAELVAAAAAAVAAEEPRR